MKRIIYFLLAGLTFLIGFALATKPISQPDSVAPLVKEQITFQHIAIGCGAGITTEIWKSSSGVTVSVSNISRASAKEAQKFFAAETASLQAEASDSRIETTAIVSPDTIISMGSYIDRESGAEKFVIIKREGKRVSQIESESLETALAFEDYQLHALRH